MESKRARSSARGEEGREFARAVLHQTPADDVSMEPNPVLRRLKEQARAGVGSAEGYLPANVFNALMDRCHGKVADRVKMLGARPFDDLSDAELAARAEQVARRLRGDKEI
jgi:hypothetical protein